MLALFRLVLVGLFLITICSCSSRKQASPEDRVRQYAQYINQGKLDEARKMCTPSGQAFLDALGEIINASASALDTAEIKIKRVECHQANDTVRCVSFEYDGFEAYEKEYWLLQSTTGWLIDYPAGKGVIEQHKEVLEKE